MHSARGASRLCPLTEGGRYWWGTATTPKLLGCSLPLCHTQLDATDHTNENICEYHVFKMPIHPPIFGGLCLRTIMLIYQSASEQLGIVLLRNFEKNFHLYFAHNNDNVKSAFFHETSLGSFVVIYLNMCLAERMCNMRHWAFCEYW